MCNPKNGIATVGFGLRSPIVPKTVQEKSATLYRSGCLKVCMYRRLQEKETNDVGYVHCAVSQLRSPVGPNHYCLTHATVNHEGVSVSLGLQRQYFVTGTG